MEYEAVETFEETCRLLDVLLSEPSFSTGMMFAREDSYAA
jgi:hypothetical protein